MGKFIDWLRTGRCRFDSEDGTNEPERAEVSGAETDDGRSALPQDELKADEAMSKFIKVYDRFDNYLCQLKRAEKQLAQNALSGALLPELRERISQLEARRVGANEQLAELYDALTEQLGVEIAVFDEEVEKTKAEDFRDLHGIDPEAEPEDVLETSFIEESEASEDSEDDETDVSDDDDEDDDDE